MALYYPPIKPNAPIFSYQNFALPNTPISPGQGGSSVTEEWLATHYLQFPNAQGVENFGYQELNLTNTTIGEGATLFLNPSASEDVTLLSNQNGGGLTVRTPDASYTLNPYPIASGIVGCQTQNPIDMNNFGLYGLNNLYLVVRSFSVSLIELIILTLLRCNEYKFFFKLYILLKS
jgi:hypothetical protein